MSAYMIKAVLSNPRHPEHGSVTIRFPIPNEEYDHCMERLKAMEFGDALQRDCCVDEVDSHYEVLKRLEGQSVNVDELDYLAKRLDSFCEGEDAQFQGMAHKLDITDIKDFINLTFCCQQATVITDFSNLESIGKQHAQNMRENGTPLEALEQADGKAIAQALILFGNGMVTPYGVVYDNGMKLEQLYDRRHFPCYHYDLSPITAGVISRSAPSEAAPKDWLYLPASQGQIRRTLTRAGIHELSDVRLCGFENMLPDGVEQALSLGRESLMELNGMSAAIALLNETGRSKLEAVVKMTAADRASQIQRLAGSLELFGYVPGAQAPEEHDDPHANHESGCFGGVFYHGTLPLEELMGSVPAEQCQGEQGQQMM